MNTDELGTVRPFQEEPEDDETEEAGVEAAEAAPVTEEKEVDAVP